MGDTGILGDTGMETVELTESLFRQQWSALGGTGRDVSFRGWRVLPGPFAVTPLGAAAFATAGAALSELTEAAGLGASRVAVDVELASAWMRHPAMPIGAWARRTPWHDVSTDYRTADGRWIRLQANYPHLREATARVLGVPVDVESFSAAIGAHHADEIEQAIVDGGGAAAASRTMAAWAAHPQGRAVAKEPLVDVEVGAVASDSWLPTAGRPLTGIKVLDITRVLAGPTATRFLAGAGAEVLRIDPTGYLEPDGRSGGDLTLGKRCAFIDLETAAGRERFLTLLAEADVFVHGLRPGALERLGLGADVRAVARPGLVDVSLNAYGWTGPWADRRGFDTLVQTSAGFSTFAMQESGGEEPQLLPAQLLDFATGYLMAAAALRGLTTRMTEGRGTTWRLALARTAALLGASSPAPEGEELILPLQGPVEERVYSSPDGPLHRLRFAVEVEGSPLFWERPGEPYGSSMPVWTTASTVGRLRA